MISQWEADVMFLPQKPRGQREEWTPEVGVWWKRTEGLLQRVHISRNICSYRRLWKEKQIQIQNNTLQHYRGGLKRTECSRGSEDRAAVRVPVNPVGQEVVALQPECSRGRLRGESSVTRSERAENDPHLLRHLKLQQAHGFITAEPLLSTLKHLQACCEQLLNK